MASSSEPDPLLNRILKILLPAWGSILDNHDHFRLQFIYTQIDRNARNQPRFSHHRYHVDRQHYFYPASLVKLPLAAFALEKINTLSIAGLSAQTPMQVVNTLSCRIPYDHEDGERPEDPVSLASSIRRMLVASDNGGYNRLWEFLTRDYANQRLSECGFGDIRLLHRLASGCTHKENRMSNPVRFIDDSGRVIYEQPPTASSIPDANPLAPVSFGNATIVNGELRPSPLTADYLNYAPLGEMHRFLIAIMFPDSAAREQSIRLQSNDYRLLRTGMELLPGESGIPRYAAYPDNFRKFFLFGDTAHPLSPTLREINVAGRAFGFLSDLAYLSDSERGIEFFLSAVIYVNANGVVNDDIYEYDSIGKPFFAALCRAVYEFETTRKRRLRPHLLED
ncbi:MAG: serine hydrolase [Chitinispirillaceae bacterium]|jgi:hypothetical protein